MKLSDRRPLLATCLCGAILFQVLGWLPAGLAIGLQHLTRGRYLETVGETVTIVLSQADFQQVKVNAYEIRIDGDMYDIKQREQIGDSIRLVLKKDHHEQYFQNTITKLVKIGSGESSKTTYPLAMWVIKGLFSTFILPQTPEIRFYSKQMVQRAVFIYRKTVFPIVHPVPTPPPQQAGC